MFVSVQMFSYICRWACVNCSKNTLFTVKSQQCDIKFLQDLHYISKKKKPGWTAGSQNHSRSRSIYGKALESTHTLGHNSKSSLNTKTATHTCVMDAERETQRSADNVTTHNHHRRAFEFFFKTNRRTSVAATSDRRTNMRLLSHRNCNSHKDANCNWLTRSIHSVCVCVCI